MKLIITFPPSNAANVKAVTDWCGGKFRSMTTTCDNQIVVQVEFENVPVDQLDIVAEDLRMLGTVSVQE